MSIGARLRPDAGGTAPRPAATPTSQRAGLRSLTNRVALLFAAVVLVAFGVVYFYIVPQLRSNLEEQVLTELDVRAEESAGQIEAVMDTDDPGPDVDMVVQRTADDVDARISLLGVQRSAGGEGFFYSIADSNVGTPGVVAGPSEERRAAGQPTTEDPDSGREEADPAAQEAGPEAGPDSGEPGDPTALPTPDVTVSVADAAVDRERIETGLGRSRGELVAQAAAPLAEARGQPPEWVAVYSRPLEDVSEAVGLIQRQVIVAGVLAVLVALGGGWLVARSVARRVRRLETAARQFAAGKAVAPLPIDSEDELGQLTRTFNEMQEQLARLDRSRRDFIANASHELRTPIFSLGGFAELLQDEDLDSETRERFLASMREQIDRLQRLASDLLDLSRLDAGALEMHPREADVTEVAKTVAHEFAPVAAERHARLSVDLPEEGLEAWCDPDRVAQIVRILLDNALRHNPEGTAVALGAARRGRGVAITVADDGQGLNGVTSERVFERFYTADSSRGSGLGLAIARELAERMGGAIGLDARPDRTAFTLELPATSESRVRGDGSIETPAARVPRGDSGGVPAGRP